MHLGAPLDVFLVRKLGVPGRDEVATGAIADGGLVVVDEDVIRGLTVLSEVFRGVAERESREMMRREQAYCVVKPAYREGRPSPDLMGRTVILVDDGLATGASMRAAVEALRGQRPVRVVVAIPAAPESTCREPKSGVDRVVRATTPSPFLAVGEAYGGLHPDQGRGGPRLAACGPVSHRVGRGARRTSRSSAPGRCPRTSSPSPTRTPAR